MEIRVMLAEPDSALADGLGRALQSDGHRVTTVRTGAEAFEAASRTAFEVFVLDVRLAGQEEASLLDFLRARHSRSRIILMSEARDAELALRASRQGAAISLMKPVRPADLAAVVTRLAKAMGEEEVIPPEDSDAPFEYRGLVGKSPIMRRVLRLVAKVAPTDSTVIITGETGTGKEMIARIIRELSPRADRAFVTVNCGAIPENLIESELFGHKRGAFTDAVADKKGLLEMANQGTILLDEVGDLPTAAQVKILRVIEDMEIRRVGDPTPVRVDVRVLAATNRDLAEEVRAGRFREDLWFRLNVVQIHLPPLRLRREEIPVLTRHFLDAACRRFGKSVIGLAPEALAVLNRYEFPGNVRELRNAVEHAVVMADHEQARVEDLPVNLVAASSRHHLLARPASPVPGATEPAFKTIAEAESDLIRWTLERLNGNQTEAAKRLGISRSTLWRKAKEYKLGV
jgi:DNA-binding NtrC family response regulator